MADEYKFSLKSKFTDFIKYCNEFGACGVGKKWNTDIQTFFPNIKEMTMQDVADIFLNDPNRDDRWVQWVLKTFGHLAPPADWMYYIKSLRVPEVALDIYLNTPWLTEEENQFLISLFKERIPNIYKDIQDGIVTKENKGIVIKVKG